MLKAIRYRRKTVLHIPISNPLLLCIPLRIRVVSFTQPICVLRLTTESTTQDIKAQKTSLPTYDNNYTLPAEKLNLSRRIKLQTAQEATRA